SFSRERKSRPPRWSAWRRSPVPTISSRSKPWPPAPLGEAAAMPPPSGSSTATRLPALRHHVLVVAPVEVAPLLVGECAAAGAHLGDFGEEARARRRGGKEQQKARRRIAVVLEAMHRPLRHVEERSRLAAHPALAVVQTDLAGDHVERLGEGG